MKHQVLLGDCLDVLRGLADNSVDSIVTDPPYGLSQQGTDDIVECLTAWMRGEPYRPQKRGFMGKDWDGWVPGPEVWRECLRVLKPGGHLLAFAGTRTQDLMTIGLRLAGFEIRDMLAWVYGCLDEQTEVATKDGVKPYHRTKIGDSVLCYNPESGEYSYQPILEIVEYEYSDTAYRLIGDFGEQVVSRNHRVIVERGGREAFQFAETLESTARIPVLESLSELQQALHDAHQRAGGQKEDLRNRVHEGADRPGKSRSLGAGRPQGYASSVLSLRSRTRQAGRMAEEYRAAYLQQTVQWSTARSGVGKARTQRAVSLEAGVGDRTGAAYDRLIKSSVEGWSDLPQPQGTVRRSADQVRALSAASAQHGAQGRLRDGASSERRIGAGPAAESNLCGASYQSRRDGQSSRESDAVRNERGAQVIRAWRGHRSSVVRVVPFHYTGKVWCLRVPTGSFVAVRNGVAFPTGNSGFPKSLDVSKAIDKQRHDREDVLKVTKWLNEKKRESVVSNAEILAVFGFNEGSGMIGHWTALTYGGQPAIPTLEQVPTLLDVLGLTLDDVPEEIRRLLWDLNGRKGQPGENWWKREVIGMKQAGMGSGSTFGMLQAEGDNANAVKVLSITAPATDAARQWDGWGTALKPALEPITVARKPLGGTVAANVLKHGTGALNIDGCRVGTSKDVPASPRGGQDRIYGAYGAQTGEESGHNPNIGRWPANLIHDGSEEATEGLGSAARFFYAAKASRSERDAGLEGMPEVETRRYGDRAQGALPQQTPQGAIIQRNHHPTVKPVALMRWLCRLVTPPGGVVLDPFAGSGSTGVAAVAEGFSSILIEREAEYIEIIRRRLAHAQGALFAEEPAYGEDTDGC
jgi:DNA modification methylase